MAALSDAERAQLHRLYMRTFPGPCGVTKAQLRAVVDAADAWADTNQAAYITAVNTALTGAGATTGAMTGAQKAEALVWVIRKRSGTGRNAVPDSEE